jgi:hypothetical protein
MDADEKRVEDAMQAPNAIFVFGSNLAGKHGKGAALTAKKFWGAQQGRAFGLMGRSYGIPTKDFGIQPLRLEVIKGFVELFKVEALHMPELLFVVTKIGCGLAGYQEREISKFFKDAPSNCNLPEGWRV